MGDEPRNLVLLVDEEEPTLGEVATALTKAQIPLIHGVGAHEARALARRQRPRVRCVLYRPETSPGVIRSVARLLAIGADLDPARHIAVGREPEAAVRLRLHEAGVQQAIWEPFDEATLCYIVRAAACPESSAGRRRHERVPTRLPVTIALRARRGEGLATTLSSSGALVESEIRLDLGERVGLRILLPDGPLSLQSVVRYKTPAEPGLLAYGVEFETPSAQDEDRLRCYVRVRRALFEV